ncbi:hypothetical protein [Prauserella shujinwangii]|uniref:hypothetical protein n=1 Tax=Prauserella shujinwangii TaxID=1453103 RepID=UPI000D0568AA|nr:hypothetical protein [Prauserella shujinwangii]
MAHLPLVDPATGTSPTSTRPTSPPRAGPTRATRRRRRSTSRSTCSNYVNKAVDVDIDFPAVTA